MNPIWYLIIAYYHGGAVVVPQVSKEDCVTQARWIMAHSDITAPGYAPNAYCVRGIK